MFGFVGLFRELRICKFQVFNIIIPNIGDYYFNINFYLFFIFSLLIEFTGVTLVNKII